MKGVVLAGGLGTRLWPMTKVINKHLLPVGAYPMIYYPVGALVEAGVRDLMIVTGGNNAGMFLELLGNGCDFGLDHINYTHQATPAGIADALRLTEHFVNRERFIVILGDNVIGGSIREHVEGFARQESGAKILLARVDDPSDTGVAVLDDAGRVTSIVEKPTEHISDHAVIGAYMYDELVWDILPELTPSGRGELEITDVNNAYLERGLLTADVLECDWGDAGRSADYLFEATVIARRNDLLSEFEGLRGATDE